MSRFHHRFGLSAFALLLSACGTPSKATDSAAERTAGADRAPAAIFGPAIAEIQNSVRMPIMLPSELPAVLQDPEIKLARGLLTADGYGIELRYDDTTGDAGSAAWFAGSTRLRRSDFAEDRHLRLANGVVGFFSPVSCGGSCSGPNLWWEENGVMYSIQMKVLVHTPEAEQEKVLLEAANASVHVGSVTAARGAR